MYLGDALPGRFRGALLCCDFLQHSASWWRLARRGSTFTAAYGGQAARQPGHLVLRPRPVPGARRRRLRLRLPRPAHRPPRPRRELGSEQRPDLPHGPAGHEAGPRPRPRPQEQAASWSSCCGTRTAGTPSRPASSSPPAATGAPGRPWPHWLARPTTRGSPCKGSGASTSAGASTTRWRPNLLRHPGGVRPGLDGPAPGRRREGLRRRSRPRLAELAAADPSVTVRCQLAATARRLPGADGLPIVERLLRRGLDRDDPYVPLMLWWAVEARALTDADRLLPFFGKPRGLGRSGLRARTPCGSSGGTPRRGRRRATSLRAAARNRAATIPGRRPGRPRPRPGRAGRIAGRHGYGRAVRLGRDPGARNPGPAAPLRAARRSRWLDAIAAAWLAAPADVLRLRLAIRAGVAEASAAVLAGGGRPGDLARRGGVSCSASSPSWRPPGSVPVALAHPGGRPSDRRAVRGARRAGPPRRRQGRVEAPRSLPEGSARSQRRGCATSCSPGRRSARGFLERVDNGEIAAAEVPIDQLRQVALHGDPRLDALVRKHWGSVQPGTAEEKLAEIRRLSNDLRAGPGRPRPRQGAVRQALRDAATSYSARGARSDPT